MITSGCDVARAASGTRTATRRSGSLASQALPTTVEKTSPTTSNAVPAASHSRIARLRYSRGAGTVVTWELAGWLSVVGSHLHGARFHPDACPSGRRRRVAGIVACLERKQMDAGSDREPADLSEPVQRSGRVCEASVDSLPAVDEHDRVRAVSEAVGDAGSLPDTDRATRYSELLDPRCNSVEPDRVREDDRPMLRGQVDSDPVVAVRAQVVRQVPPEPAKRQPPGRNRRRASLRTSAPFASMTSTSARPPRRSRKRTLALEVTHPQTGENVFDTRVPAIGAGVSFSRSVTTNAAAVAAIRPVTAATANHR